MDVRQRSAGGSLKFAVAVVKTINPGAAFVSCQGFWTFGHIISLQN